MARGVFVCPAVRLIIAPAPTIPACPAPLLTPPKGRNTMILVNLDNVAKYYGTHCIFENMAWQIDEHEKIGLVGPNGAGKSTLLRLLSGIDPADEGQVAFRRGLKVA